MHPAVRVVIAVVCGAVVAFALVAGIEALGQKLVPAPQPIDLARPDAMHRLPLATLLFVVAAWIVATFMGGVVAAFIARRRVVLASAGVGVLVLAATVANFVLIPHPAWMIVIGVLGIVLAAMAAGNLVKRRRGASPVP